MLGYHLNLPFCIILNSKFTYKSRRSRSYIGIVRKKSTDRVWWNKEIVTENAVYSNFLKNLLKGIMKTPLLALR